MFHLRGAHKVGEPITCPHCGRCDFQARNTYYRHLKQCKNKA